MKTISLINILDQRKIHFHVMIVLLSLIMPLLLSIGNLKSFPTEFQINLFILLIIQLEVFFLVAHWLFIGLKPGKTRKELTKTVLSRFSLFMVICFFAALIINILFIYILNLIHGNPLNDVIGNFFRYEFGGWIKSTVGGLLFGAAIFIFIQWQDALTREQKLREENLVFQNETLRNQVNPHFLFNSLNTISSLIVTQPETAERFVNRLSSIYRYILENRTKDKVPLTAELAFIKEYFDLHKIRDEEKILLSVEERGADRFEILPVSLQILIENAIKHNMATRENPLRISIYIESQHVIVHNNLQKMTVQLKSTKIGLNNLAERVRLVTGKKLIIEETANDFLVKVPLSE
jgi:two-component system, LytTR family, sensor kinase